MTKRFDTDQIAHLREIEKGRMRKGEGGLHRHFQTFIRLMEMKVSAETMEEFVERQLEMTAVFAQADAVIAREKAKRTQPQLNDNGAGIPYVKQRHGAHEMRCMTEKVYRNSIQPFSQKVPSGYRAVFVDEIIAFNPWVVPEEYRQCLGKDIGDCRQRWMAVSGLERTVSLEQARRSAGTGITLIEGIAILLQDRKRHLQHKVLCLGSRDSVTGRVVAVDHQSGKLRCALVDMSSFKDDKNYYVPTAIDIT